MATILVVDDRPTNREFLVTLLGYKGHQVLQASDGAEALQVVRAAHPDLVLTDVLMPTVDGYEFVRQLRSDPVVASTPVVFYSAAYHRRELQDLAPAAGVVRHISKPAPPDEILKSVDEVLAAGPLPVAPPPITDAYDREHLRLLTNKLVSQVNQVESLNERLSTLLELGQQIALEHDPLRLLETFCLKSRQLVAARYAVVAFSDDSPRQLRHCVRSGFEPEWDARLGRSHPNDGLLGFLLKQPQPVRMAGVPAQNIAANDLHPPANAFLSVPLATPSLCHGVLYFLDKVGSNEFSEEDERIAGMLAAQLAVAYESALRQEHLEAARKDVLDYAGNLEKRVAERTSQLRESMQALESFAYTVAHDLRSPLRAIRSFSTLMLEGCQGCSNQQSQGFLKKIAGASIRMDELIDDLLAYSRLSQAELPCASVSLELLVNKILNRLTDDIAAKNAVVQTERPLPRVLANETVLDQVLTNLVTNALKFTRPNVAPEVKLWAEIRDRAGEPAADAQTGAKVKTPVSKTGLSTQTTERAASQEARSRNPSVRVCVQDNGIGIEPAEHGTVFQVFHRLHSSAQYPGTGIGLAIVQKGMERMGGRGGLESSPGQGSLFWIELMLDESKGAPE